MKKWNNCIRNITINKDIYLTDIHNLTGYTMEFANYDNTMQMSRISMGTRSPRSPRSPRTPRSPQKVVKYNNIQEQLDFAVGKYDEVLRKFMNTPCCNITQKLQEDVWAWGLFSETVLPMLKFIDEE